MTEVITVDGYNRLGKLDTIRLAKAPRSRLVALRRLQDERAAALRDSFNTPIPMGMTAAEWRAAQTRLRCKNSLPLVTACDYDIGPANGLNGGEIAWLVGGNDSSELPECPSDGFFNLGVDVPLPADDETGADAELRRELANCGIDIITAGDERIRIFGTATDDPDYQECMEGRVIIANGFIENEECPAELVVIPTGTLTADDDGMPLAIADLYLERPANAYNVIIDDAIAGGLFVMPLVTEEFFEELELALAPFADPTTGPFTEEALIGFLLAALDDPEGPAGIALEGFVEDLEEAGITTPFALFVTRLLPLLAIGVEPGQRVLLINNIFLGDAPATPYTSLATYNPNGANALPVPTGLGTQLYNEMGIGTFDYLLKVINTSGSEIALIFNTGVDGIDVVDIPLDDLLATNMAIYSNFNFNASAPLIIEAGGAAFIKMRVEDSRTHIMLYNVKYTEYTEPELATVV